MEPDTLEELLEDCLLEMHAIKGDRRLWNGDVGLCPARRENINELIQRYKTLKGKPE
jgi:hypothetical protein